MDRLAALLSSFRNSEYRIHHVVPGGNHGDTLIYRGSDKLLERIEFTRKTNYLSSDSLALIGGGGNMTDLWPHGLEKLWSVLGVNILFPVMVQPQSYYFTETDFADRLHSMLPRTLWLFCRERYSHDLLSSLGLPWWVNVEMGHCPSLYLTREDFPGNYEPEYALVCFREDKEKGLNHAEREYIIASARQLYRDVLVQEVCNQARVPLFDDFVTAVAKAHTIYTDHLHVAILGGVVFGRKVHLWPGCYHKIKGVYEYSLRRYDNIILRS